MKDWINYMIHEEGKTVLDRDGGLIAFTIKGEECYVSDFYVKEEMRGSGVAIKLARDAVNYAKDLGCKFMTCNIFINESNKKMFAHKVRIFSNFGFLPQSANNNVITMFKEI